MSKTNSLRASLTDPTSGEIMPERLAHILRISSEEMAKIVPCSEAELRFSPSAKEKLAQVVDLLALVVNLANGDIAFAASWFVRTPLAGFPGQTPAELVSQGRVNAVRMALVMMQDGGYA